MTSGSSRPSRSSESSGSHQCSLLYIGIITHQSHISQVNTNDYRVSEWVTLITSRASCDAKNKNIQKNYKKMTNAKLMWVTVGGRDASRQCWCGPTCICISCAIERQRAKYEKQQNILQHSRIIVCHTTAAGQNMKTPQNNLQHSRIIVCYRTGQNM